MFPLIQATPTTMTEVAPPNPATINIIIGLGALTVLIILLGVWINKTRL